ncbi:MAG: hypothetical protein ACXU85_14225, partial [Xanthobacteraceae bacterium]
MHRQPRPRGVSNFPATRGCPPCSRLEPTCASKSANVGTIRTLGVSVRFAHTKDSTLTSFLDLGLSEPITRALVDEQYATPTPIQAQTIPQVL